MATSFMMVLHKVKNFKVPWALPMYTACMWDAKLPMLYEFFVIRKYKYYLSSNKNPIGYIKTKDHPKYK